MQGGVEWLRIGISRTFERLTWGTPILSCLPNCGSDVKLGHCHVSWECGYDNRSAGAIEGCDPRAKKPTALLTRVGKHDGLGRM